jgi:hypothetical protein
VGSRTLAAAALPLALAGCAGSRAGRLSEFEATLAAQDSATTALGQWCAERHMAQPPLVRAAPVPGDAAATPPDVRALLNVAPGEPLGYRHVRLTCGDAVLSEAHNWYVPARLTPSMNAILSATEKPFGKVIAPLRFTRERLASIRGRAAGCPAGTILSHRALLRLPDGSPVSLVLECYTQANLARR